ncbi:MAG TPA: pitrilysin family protein [Anaerolineales bacterium]
MAAAQPSLPGPDDIHRQVLPNGITILTRPNFNSAAVTVSGYLPAGALAESEEKLGLADFTASALMRGTSRRSFDAIFNDLESAGASFGYDSATHTTSFGGRALVEDLGLLLGLLSETLCMPAFPDEELEKLRAQLLTGLALRAQDTSDMADLIFDQLIFDGHPYAHPGDGWPETVQSITRQDMVDFHRRFFGPRGMVIAIVGGIEPAKAVGAVEQYLGEWRVEGQKEMPLLPALRPLTGRIERRHRIAGKAQSDLVIGTYGPRRTDSWYAAASLGNSVLGQFGMMGRIGEVVRERAGLAYYAYSSLRAGLGPGTWTASAGVNPMNVDRAIELIISELERFMSEGVTAEELADCQANFSGRLPLGLESNGGVTSALLKMERFGLGLDYYRTYADRINRVTREDVLETARKYIAPEILAISVAGP